MLEVCIGYVLVCILYVLSLYWSLYYVFVVEYKPTLTGFAPVSIQYSFVFVYIRTPSCSSPPPCHNPKKAIGGGGYRTRIVEVHVQKAVAQVLGQQASSSGPLLCAKAPHWTGSSQLASERIRSDRAGLAKEARFTQSLLAKHRKHCHLCKFERGRRPLRLAALAELAGQD